MKRRWVFGSILLAAACQTDATLRSDSPEETGLQAEPEGAAPPVVVRAEELTGTGFLPRPLRPSDPSLLELDDFIGGLRALREGEARTAALALDQARRDQGGHAQLAALQAWALLEGGEALDAVRVARPAAEGGEPAAQYALGRALYLVGDRSEAHEWLQRSRRGFEDPEAYLPWALECALAAGAPETALAELDRMRLDGPLPAAWGRTRARALAQADRHDEAMAQYDLLLQGGAAEDPGLWNEAGGVLFRAALDAEDHETYRRAAGYFGRAAEQDPQEARYRFNLACAQDWGGQLVEAEASYRRALELRPHYLEAYENLVLLLQGQERHSEALASQQQMLRQPLSPAELERVLAAVK